MVLSILIVTFAAAVSAEFDINNLPKCCSSENAVLEINSTLKCVLNEHKRLEIKNKNVNFINEIDKGRCADSNNEDFYIYEFNEDKIITKEKITTKYFQKCCPLGMIYNTESFSCIKNIFNDESWIIGKYIKIGLPKCKFIRNKILSASTNINNIIFGPNNTDDKQCVDKDNNNNFVLRECQEKFDDICRIKKCIRKCCADGQSLVVKDIVPYCEDTHVHGFSLNISKEFHKKVEIDNIADDYHIIYKSACVIDDLPQLYRISNKIRINKDGVFSYYHHLHGEYFEEHYDHPTSYCIEHARIGDTNDFFVFNCLFKGYNTNQYEEKFTWTYWSKILSCICLVLTVIIYPITGKLKTLFGKILINYCLALFFLYILLLDGQYSSNPGQMACKLKGYSLTYFTIAVFAWLTVMSLDLCQTLCRIESTLNPRETRKIILYSFYGWGFPAVHTLTIFLFAEKIIDVLPHSIQPYVGFFKCFLENRGKNYSKQIFLFVPLFILQMVNIFLFAKTAIYCLHVGAQVKKMDEHADGINCHRNRLKLIVKLAVIMGLGYIYELVMSLVHVDPSNPVTKVLFVINNIYCLQGVCIFIIFICKRKTLDSLKKRPSRSRFAHSTSESTSTSRFQNLLQESHSKYRQQSQ